MKICHTDALTILKNRVAEEVRITSPPSLVSSFNWKCEAGVIKQTPHKG